MKIILRNQLIIKWFKISINVKLNSIQVFHLSNMFIMFLYLELKNRRKHNLSCRGLLQQPPNIKNIYVQSLYKDKVARRSNNKL